MVRPLTCRKTSYIEFIFKKYSYNLAYFISNYTNTDNTDTNAIKDISKIF